MTPLDDVRSVHVEEHNAHGYSVVVKFVASEDDFTIVGTEAEMKALAGAFQEAHHKMRMARWERVVKGKTVCVRGKERDAQWLVGTPWLGYVLLCQLDENGVVTDNMSAVSVIDLVEFYAIYGDEGYSLKDLV